MRKSLATIAGAAMLAAFAATPAHSQKLTPVNPYPQSTQTIVFGINDDGVIAGSYRDGNNVEHGFFGPLNGQYTSFDFGGSSTGTEPRALDDSGNIVGFATDASFTIGEEFFRDEAGKIANIRRQRIPLDGIAQGMTTKVRSVGDYLIPGSGNRTGYLAKKGKYQADISLDGATQVSPRAVDSSGATAGFFIDQVGARHGFLMDASGLTIVDADASGTTALEGLSPPWGHDKGPFYCVAGQFTGSDGSPHSFLLNTQNGKLTAVNIAGSTYQQAWGVNKFNEVAVGTDIGSFIYNSSQAPAGGKHGCPSGGADARLAHAKVLTSLHYTSFDRTSAPKFLHPVVGAVQ